MIESAIGFALLFLILFARIPLAFCMAFVGFVGYWYVLGFTPRAFDASLAMAGRRIIDTAMEYNLSVIPLFILMGNLVTRSGLSDAVYRASNAFIGHLRGGQAMATILACGGFSAICGSSLATAATMSKVAMPQMRRFGYSDSLASATIAAGGTLGILIPPSVILVIYGIITEQSISKLFAAGLLPGILGVFLYLLAVYYSVMRKNDHSEVSPKTPWPERFKALWHVSHTLLLFALVIGGIYLGWFVPVEAAGIGAFGALLIAIFSRKLSFRDFMDTLAETARTSCTLFSIVIAALIFSNFINRAGLPQELLNMIINSGLTPMMIILAIILIYLILGCMLESMSMLLLTIPLFFPIVQGMGMDLIWFGIVVVIAIEISLITPPVGMNVFVLQSVMPDVKSTTIFRGITPFIVVDLVRILLIAFIPAIALWLPELFHVR